jgi:hypothetical protein
MRIRLCVWSGWLSKPSAKLITRFDNAATLERQVEAGEPFDVLILSPAQVDDLIGQGRIVAGTRTDIAKAMVGMAMRADLPPNFRSRRVLPLAQQTSEKWLCPAKRTNVGQAPVALTAATVPQPRRPSVSAS